MKQEDKDMLKLLFMLIIFGVVASMLIGVANTAIMKYECSQHQSVTKRETMSDLSTCYVKTKSGWVTYSEYRLSSLSEK